jgi:hypothetical protein
MPAGQPFKAGDTVQFIPSHCCWPEHEDQRPLFRLCAKLGTASEAVETAAADLGACAMN